MTEGRVERSLASLLLETELLRNTDGFEKSKDIETPLQMAENIENT